MYVYAVVMDARGKFPNFLSASIINIRTAKMMNQFFYNMMTTYWAQKHVLWLISKFSQCTLKENKDPNETNTLNLVSKIVGNVGKQSHNTRF